MPLDSIFRTHAFKRYLRSGIPLELQWEILGEEKRAAFWKAQALPRSANSLVRERVQQLQQQFHSAGLQFPSRATPDTMALQKEYAREQQSLNRAFAERPANMSEADWSHRQAAAQRFLESRFRQKIDPIIQPHYGVQYFTWTTGSDNPCANCSAHEGQTYEWGSSQEPPGCSHCQCSAEPYLGARFDSPIEPVYPIESALLLLSGGEAVAMIRNAVGVWRGAEAANEKYKDAIEAIEKYFEGPPQTRLNKKDDVVMMKDGKKIRFDAENEGHGYEEHFHIQEFDPKTGKWVDAGKQHMYPFRKE